MVGSRLNDVRIEGFRTRDPDFRRRPRRPDPDVMSRLRCLKRTPPSVRKWSSDHTDLRRCARCGRYGDQSPPSAGDWLVVPGEHPGDPWEGAWRLCPDCHYAVMRLHQRHERTHGWIRDMDGWLRKQAANWPQRGRCRLRQHEGSAAP